MVGQVGVTKSKVVRGNALIDIRPIDGSKNWVYLTLLKSRQLIIAFEHLFYLIKYIAECEEEKYPRYFHKGKEMVADFLADVVWGDNDYETLADKYKLPKR